MIVYHKVFGYGKVLEVKEDAYVVLFDNLKTFRNIKKEFVIIL